MTVYKSNDYPAGALIRGCGPEVDRPATTDDQTAANYQAFFDNNEQGARVLQDLRHLEALRLQANRDTLAGILRVTAEVEQLGDVPQ